MTVETIQPIVEKIIQENLPDAFLVSIKVNMGLKSSIQIFVDTDKGITIEECSLLSRKIGRHFDEQDFIDFSYELEVSSPGLNNPLILPRQYQKNIGRALKVITQKGEKYEGILTHFDGDTLTLEIEQKNPSTKKKELHQQKIHINEIKEAIVQVGKKKEKKKN
ncbi:MAG: ribosome maturation factor RimP [Bacteroidia bacterium]|nr:MAG: ribosome maturation factor RimP [Bacteroidia bacterium]